MIKLLICFICCIQGLCAGVLDKFEELHPAEPNTVLGSDVVDNFVKEFMKKRSVSDKMKDLSDLDEVLKVNTTLYLSLSNYFIIYSVENCDISMLMNVLSKHPSEMVGGVSLFEYLSSYKDGYYLKFLWASYSICENKQRKYMLYRTCMRGLKFTNVKPENRDEAVSKAFQKYLDSK